jgi:hypothetical protein
MYCISCRVIESQKSRLHFYSDAHVSENGILLTAKEAVCRPREAKPAAIETPSVAACPTLTCISAARSISDRTHIRKENEMFPYLENSVRGHDAKFPAVGRGGYDGSSAAREAHDAVGAFAFHGRYGQRHTGGLLALSGPMACATLR